MTDKLEIERKWRLLEPPSEQWYEGLPLQRLTQTYVVIDPGEERVRTDGATCWMTVKSDGDIKRPEWEVEIPQWVYAQLAASTSYVILKTRYAVPGAGRIWEMDVYAGALVGLVIVEVEYELAIDLSEEAEAAAIAEIRSRPFYTGFGPAVEVTDDKRYKNKWLAVYGLPPEALGS